MNGESHQACCTDGGAAWGDRQAHNRVDAPASSRLVMKLTPPRGAEATVLTFPILALTSFLAECFPGAIAGPLRLTGLNSAASW